jgi:hypothetical protein
VNHDLAGRHVHRHVYAQVTRVHASDETILRRAEVSNRVAATPSGG